MTSPLIKIALADDHRLFRDGIKMVLTEMKNITVVWEAADGSELLTRLEECQPDAILLDLRMPQIDGLSVLPLIRKNYDQVKVIVISTDTSPKMITRMVELGANTYLSKNTDPDELYTAITACMKYGYYFTHQMNEALLNQLQGGQVEQKESLITLSEKERYVLLALAAEKSTEEIAKEGAINPRTIEAIRSRLKTKTGTKSTVGLVLYALRAKLI
jgi:DNA-binding NarL/FixJ family response regulator